ncbi:MAG: GntR family transcriptional regulator [Burkholderiaceae bacterium]|nr:GntR family transcriptional regulator [Burkholderiaceae bacterium]
MSDNKKNTISPGKPTLYQKLADQLIEMIKSEHYPVGTNLPTEMELCVTFGVSRHTVRDAIRRLDELGLVERRRRAGTTVIRQHPEPKFGLALETTDQLQRYLEFTDLRVSKVVGTLKKQPPETALDGEASHWLKVETYRSVPGTKRAISWTDIYLRQEYQHIVDMIGKQPGGVYPLLEAHCNEVVDVIEMEISAATFPAHVARSLGYLETDPALLMIRRFINPAGKTLEVAVSYYPPYEFRYVARLARGNGGHQTRN